MVTFVDDATSYYGNKDPAEVTESELGQDAPAGHLEVKRRRGARHN